MTARVAIVGAGGGVGSSVAYNLLLREEPYEIALVDGRSGMAVSHEMDLQQVVVQGASGSARIVELGEIARAEVVVLTASVPLTVNSSRLVYLRENAAIMKEVLAALGEPGAWPGVLLVVTNPVDALCTWMWRRFGLERTRVIGYTANDSWRLRTGIAEAVGAPPAAVDAWVLGEHGDGCVPLFDRVTVGGERVVLDEERRRAADEFLRGWYVRHVALDSARSSTWTSGLGVARMVAALTGSGDELWPAAVVLDGEYGLRDVALTVPVTLGAGGVAAVHEWELAPAERAALGESAARVRDAAASLG